MADVSTSSSSLKMSFYFVDGDTRTTTLKNPKGDITTSEIAELESFMRTNNIIVGDKMAGTFGKIEEVKKIVEYKTYVDFINE